MTSNLPDRIDRPTLERILQRATELQASEREIGENLTADDVLSLGRDVGIPAHYLRQAMLEERSRVALRTPAGAMDRIFGPAEVTAVRVVAGEQAAIERALLAWMEKNELLAVQRQQPGRISWERITGMQAALRRGAATFDSKRARFMLSRATEVHAAVTPLEPGYHHVTLTAELGKARGGVVGGTAAGASLGLAGAAVLLALNAWTLVALSPLALGAGLAWGLSRQFRPVASRAQLGLERALDHAEGAGVKPAHELPPRTAGLLEAIVGEVRRAIAAPPAERKARR